MSRFLEFFEGIEGGLSFKRLQTCVFVLLFATAVIANLFWGFVLSESLTELLAVMIMYGYTGIVIEKFSKRGMTSTAANDQAMLLETKAAVEQKKVDDAIETGEKLDEIQKEKTQ